MKKSGMVQATSVWCIPKTIVVPRCASLRLVVQSKSIHYDKKCENTAHNERCLLNSFYICKSVDKLR